jgi:putative ABC transport system permease protein
VRVAGERAAGLVAPLPAALVAAAARWPEVAQLRPQRVQPLLLDPQQAAVALLSRPIDLKADAEHLRGELPLVGEPAPPRPGCVEVAVSEALQALHGAAPGALLHLPLSRAGAEADAGTSDHGCAATDERGVVVHVRAVWRDYARQQGALVIDRRDLARLTGTEVAQAPANDLALWLRPGVDAARLKTRLEGELQALVAAGAAPAGTALQFATPAEIRRLSLAVFDRSFVVTRWLQAVAIGLGLVGVAASFSAQVLARRKEFGALQHLGFTRRQLVALVAGEGALWCGLGALLGLLLGLVISVILVNLVNPQSFHWTMDLSVPAARLATLAVAVVLAGAGAAAWAGRSAASAQMAQAVKEDW